VVCVLIDRAAQIPVSRYRDEFISIAQGQVAKPQPLVVAAARAVQQQDRKSLAFYGVLNFTVVRFQNPAARHQAGFRRLHFAMVARVGYCHKTAGDGDNNDNDDQESSHVLPGKEVQRRSILCADQFLGWFNKAAPLSFD